MAMVAGPTAQAIEPTLMLACKGTVTIKAAPPLEYSPDPVSMGFIVNFTTRTVQGTARWGPYLFDDQIPITEWNEGTVVFSGFSKFLGANVSGYMDRVTGDVGMVATAIKELPGPSFDYALKCSPTRRVLE
jgi:hypothetical protein